MSRFDPGFTALLGAASARHNRRVLRAVEPRRGPVVERAGRLLVNFSGNDYLGLSQHPLLIERAQEWTARWGAASRPSRLVPGTLGLHQAEAIGRACCGGSS